MTSRVYSSYVSFTQDNYMPEFEKVVNSPSLLGRLSLEIPSLSSSSSVSSSSSPPQYVNNHLVDYHFSSQYELGEEIGRGGYGFVLSAFHRVTRREVAVKFIYKEKLPSTAWDYQNNLPMEISILKQIHHPTIIDYIDSFEDGVYYYLVMELYGYEWKSSPPAPVSHTNNNSGSNSLPRTPDDTMPSSEFFGSQISLGGKSSAEMMENKEQQQQQENNNGKSIKVRRSSCDLFECIERHHRLTETQAKVIFRQVAQCVYDLSENNIFHRDIKDENIVIDSDFKVKLIDFGSAIRIPGTMPRDMFTLDRFHGTISFAAPEILLGISYKPEPAEVWSLGVLLYTLLYGQTPFQSSTQVLAGQWQRRAYRKSPDCMDLLQGLLKSNPQKRLSIKEIVNHPWLHM